jgi:eukaryotic-like serine/threonine-protein kinase
VEGTIIDGRYRITRAIGAGGMAEVYEAEHIELRRKVALKLVNRSIACAADNVDLWFARFQREARAVVATSTPHVAQVFDAGVDAERGVPYMAMELLDGEDLRALLRRTGTLDPSVAFRVAAQACRGLKQAHESGVVHRDIKPGNLFLHRGQGDRVVVKVLDFGVAKFVAEPLIDPDSAELTQTGSMLGTPQYMSPEQVLASKRVDFRTDLWSLGIVLYKMLTGSTPFSHAQTVGQAVLAICTEPFESVQRRAPWVSSAQAAVVTRALKRDPEQRFSSADAMLDALLAVTGGEEQLKTRDLASGPTPPPPARSSAPAVASGGILRDVNDTATAVTARASVPNARTAAPHRSRSVWIGALLGLAVLGGIAALYGRPSPLPTLGVSALRGVDIGHPSAPASSTPDVAPIPTAEHVSEAVPVARTPGAHRGVSNKPASNKPAPSPTEPLPGAQPAPSQATPRVKKPIDLRPEFE